MIREFTTKNKIKTRLARAGAMRSGPHICRAGQSQPLSLHAGVPLDQVLLSLLLDVWQLHVSAYLRDGLQPTLAAQTQLQISSFSS